MADITISQGDYGFTLTFTVQTATGGAYDLTGKTIAVKVWHPSKPSALLVNGAGAIVTASTGICTYTPASTDFLAKGLYKCELELTELGKQDSTKTYILEVTESA
jgi:hypothetical protein